MNIQPIVEGHGDVEAVPVLLRRLQALNNSGFGVNRALRFPRSRIIQESGLRYAVEIAMKMPACAAILILIDADDDCPKELGPALAVCARAAAGRIPCDVVLANKEYESWFLASFDSLREKYFRTDAVITAEPELIRGAKERVEQYMPQNVAYVERKHQPAMTALFDFNQAALRSRSFRKLVKAFGTLCDIDRVKLSYDC